MKPLFISYRRRDNNHAAGRIADRLAAEFGVDAVFRDVASLPEGATFRDRILRMLSGSDLVLVVMSDHWLGVSRGGLQNRLYDDDDFLRLELEFALKQDVPILPVCIDGVKLPAPEELPDSIRQLAGFQAASVRDSDFDRDVQRLIETIKSCEGRKRIDIPTPAVGEPVTGEHLVLRHTSWRMANLDDQYRPNKVYGFAVDLDGDPRVLERVELVLYLLPPAWGNEGPKRIGRESPRFLMKNLAWSDYLVIRARVYIREQGAPVFLSAFVRITETGPRLDA